MTHISVNSNDKTSGDDLCAIRLTVWPDNGPNAKELTEKLMKHISESFHYEVTLLKPF